MSFSRIRYVPTTDTHRQDEVRTQEFEFEAFDKTVGKRPKNSHKKLFRFADVCKLQQCIEFLRFLQFSNYVLFHSAILQNDLKSEFLKFTSVTKTAKQLFCSPWKLKLHLIWICTTANFQRQRTLTVGEVSL